MSTEGIETSTEEWRVARAIPGDLATLEALLQLYVHDFSEWLGELPGQEGRFAATPLERYLDAQDRHAFVLRSSAHALGFALLSRTSRVSGDPRVMDMTEFFVVRGARRRGVGRSAACQLFALFPGAWEVRVMKVNERALAFWRASVGSVAAFDMGDWTGPSGRAFHVLRFDNRTA